MRRGSRLVSFHAVPSFVEDNAEVRWASSLSGIRQRINNTARGRARGSSERRSVESLSPDSIRISAVRLRVQLRLRLDNRRRSRDRNAFRQSLDLCPECLTADWAAPRLYLEDRINSHPIADRRLTRVRSTGRTRRYLDHLSLRDLSASSPRRGRSSYRIYFHLHDGINERSRPTSARLRYGSLSGAKEGTRGNSGVCGLPSRKSVKVNGSGDVRIGGPPASD